ncbi:hypothetical protein E2C01_094125 [Portunus trituberculatus]|uniref:Uncharacterized protein n=1 Tax=Portunus trituberculatus TaxID=210409 RepID=A0A5B7K298_PORTR|nr:hypothetical protein [Portunus trituberculatus]
MLCGECQSLDGSVPLCNEFLCADEEAEEEEEEEEAFRSPTTRVLGEAWVSRFL